MANLTLTVKVRWWLRPLTHVLVAMVRCGFPGPWAMRFLSFVGPKGISLKVGNE